MRSDVLTGNALLVSKEKGKGKLSRTDSEAAGQHNQARGALPAWDRPPHLSPSCTLLSRVSYGPIRV